MFTPQPPSHPKMMVKSMESLFPFSMTSLGGTNPHLANVLGRMVYCLLRKAASLWTDIIISRCDLFYWPENEADTENGKQWIKEEKCKTLGSITSLSHGIKQCDVSSLQFPVMRENLYFKFDFSIYPKIS